MIEQVPMERLFTSYGVRDMFPQAILDQPVSVIAKVANLKFETLEDELDEFKGAGFIVDNQFIAAFKHYNGHPAGQTTIYLPDSMSEVQQISKIIREILKEIQLTTRSLKWERQMNPEL